MARTKRGTTRRLSDLEIERQVSNAVFVAAGRPTHRNRRTLYRARMVQAARVTARIERLGWVS